MNKKQTAIKLRNKKQWVIAQVNTKGFLSYKQIMNVTGWDLNNMHSTFRKDVLVKCGLVKTSMHGRKGYTLNNKSKAARLIITQRASVLVDDIKEVTGWDSHVINSVFRKSVLSTLNVTKYKRGTKAVYRAA